MIQDTETEEGDGPDIQKSQCHARTEGAEAAVIGTGVDNLRAPSPDEMAPGRRIGGNCCKSF